MTLEAAMEALARGERSAFDEVYTGLYPVVASFCAKYLGREDAKDATQHVLERLFHQAGNYRPGNSVKTWALTIAYWECRTVRKRRARNREQSEPDTLEAHPADAPLPDALAERRQAINALNAALDGVSEADRRVIAESIMQTAATSAAFRKRKQRALERVRVAWRRIYGES